MQGKKAVELLAPAGSYEGFLAVMEAGADAAYISGQMFGARAFARNCTSQELLECIDLAHIYGKKLYLTVNTLLKNQELNRELLPFLTPLVEAGLDAVLVQDFGVLDLLHRTFPSLALHASTQMTVTGPAALTFLQAQGVTRVVPARELSLKELAEMKKDSGMEVEVFIHGSLCYCYSGLCLLSSFLGGRSGNRGRCAQPCRLEYEAGRNTAPSSVLSMKDLNTLSLLPELVRAGVDSLKIEGRMKSPAYAASVTRIYRHYLDLALEAEAGEGTFQIQEEDRRKLLETYSRGGSCSGYLHRHNGPEMIFFKNEKKIGAQVSEEENRSFFGPKRGLKGTVIIRKDQPALLQLATLSPESATVQVEGARVSASMAAPLTMEAVRKQMNRLGNEPFFWEKLDICLEDDCFLAVSAINSLRREGIRQLRANLTASFGRIVCLQKPVEPERVAEKKPADGQPGLLALCRTEEALQTVLAHPEVEGFYLPPELSVSWTSILASQGKKTFTVLPHILRQPDLEAARSVIDTCARAGTGGFLVRCLEEYGLLKEMGLTSLAILDHSMYTWNQTAVDFWLRQGVCRLTAPLEQSGAELAHLQNDHTEMVIYGYLPLMVSAQCVKKNIGSCDQAGHGQWLTDRYKKRFFSSCCCAPWKMPGTPYRGLCYNILYNSLPLDLTDLYTRLIPLGMTALRLEFNLENPEEIHRVLDRMKAVREGMNPGQRPEGSFTRGHFRKGAE